MREEYKVRNHLLNGDRVLIGCMGQKDRELWIKAVIDAWNVGRYGMVTLRRSETILRVNEFDALAHFVLVDKDNHRWHGMEYHAGYGMITPPMRTRIRLKDGLVFA